MCHMYGWQQISRGPLAKNHIKYKTFKCIFMIRIKNCSLNAILVNVLARCREAAKHCLSQC